MAVRAGAGGQAQWGGMVFVRQRGLLASHTSLEFTCSYCQHLCFIALLLPSQRGRGASARIFWRVEMSAAGLHLFGDWMDDVIWQIAATFEISRVGHFLCFELSYTGCLHHEIRLTLVLWIGSLNGSGQNAGKGKTENVVNQVLISWLLMTFGFTDNVEITLKKVMLLKQFLSVQSQFY